MAKEAFRQIDDLTLVCVTYYARRLVLTLVGRQIVYSQPLRQCQRAESLDKSVTESKPLRKASADDRKELSCGRRKTSSDQTAERATTTDKQLVFDPLVICHCQWSPCSS